MEPSDEELLNRCIDVSTTAFQSMYDSKEALARSQEEAQSTTPHAAREEPHAAQEEIEDSSQDSAEEGGEINEAKYAKVGRKDRQAALFPELQKEGEKVRSGLSDGSIKFEDQSGEAFKEEITGRSENLINKDLTKKQRDSFVNRILRCFSTCFWIQGCSAPQVEGFTANIKLKPDAVGKCQQPFKLSAYDQYRVEVHEDVLIAEGKAVWAPPGMALAFASQGLRTSSFSLRCSCLSGRASLSSRVVAVRIVVDRIVA